MNFKINLFRSFKTKNSILIYFMKGMYRALKKPSLNEDQKTAREQFCDVWLERKSDCSKLVMVDEKKFCGGPTNNQVTVVRKKGERYNESHVVSHKRPSAHSSCNILLCITPLGKGPIYLAEHKDWFNENAEPINKRKNKGKPPGFDAASYENIVKNKLIPHLRDKLQNDYIFMQDNCGVHVKRLDPKDKTSKTEVQKLFDLEQIEVVNLPPHSPDLHPIENCLSFLSKQFNKILCNLKLEYMPKNKKQTFDLLKRAWNQVPNDHVISAYSSFYSRLEKVKVLKGNNNYCA
jgi:hypothetical protein